MAKITSVVKGSSFMFVGTVDGLTEHHLNDSQVDIKAIFYGVGKYSAEGEGVVTVAKSDMKIEEDTPDTFSCYVDTTTIPAGVMAAAVEITYPSPIDQTGQKKIKETVQVSISSQIQIINLS